jgi:hypothetical protein
MLLAQGYMWEIIGMLRGVGWTDCLPVQVLALHQLTCDRSVELVFMLAVARFLETAAKCQCIGLAYSPLCGAVNRAPRHKWQGILVGGNGFQAEFEYG